LPEPQKGTLLRIGLLIDSYEQPKWVDAVLARIQQLPSVEISVVVLSAGSPDSGGGSSTATRPFARRIAGWYRNRRHLLYALYERLDRTKFGSADDPLAPISVEARLRDVPRMTVQPRQTRHSDYFSSEALEELRQHDLDVIVRLGFRILKGEILTLPRHGVWSYHHGDNRSYRGGPPAFWEVMDGADTTGAILQVLTERLDDGIVLDRTIVATEKLSVAKNRAKLYWKAAALLPRTLARLQQHGVALAEPNRSPSEPPWVSYSRPLYTAPRNGPMARMAARLLSRYVAAKWESATTLEQWMLFFRSAGQVDDIDSVPQRALYNLQALEPPSDRYWADPFPIRYNGRHYIFAEEVVFREPKGRIVVFELTSDGKAQGPTPVLVRPYHLSYPCVFAWNSNMYMIPETRANRSVELYRATNFPFEWELDRTLLSDIRAADATVARIGDRWWMFVNVQGADEPNNLESWEDLHVFYADSPLGPWTSHARNPVKSDVSSARPAGRPFQWRGAYYRPAQNCSRGYGSSISINRIELLSPDEYREVEVARVMPEWLPGLIGVHTLNAEAGLTVVDAKRRIKKWR
jgi:methionyl-tRNA formyltransferase